jgi:hypothetical protein
MKNILPLFIVLILLTGSITQTYTQSTDSLGVSTVEEKRDLSPILQLFADTALSDIKSVCDSYTSFNCAVEGTILTSQISINPVNSYYTLETDSGFPFTTTTLTIERIPTDLFDSKINSILEIAKLTSGKGSADPIDLNQVQANKAKAQALNQSGIVLIYSVTMPNGETSEHNLNEILQDSKPITIKSQQINFGLIILILGVVVLGFLFWSFFGNRSGRK